MAGRSLIYRIFVGVLVLHSGMGWNADGAPRRPNVVVIYTDDQGTVDLGCYGSRDLATPHLDRLATRGIRFTQMYAPSAICSASRAGLLTGRFPYRAGVPGNVPSQEGKPGLPASEVTMAEMLKAGGYSTGHVGKWHLGYTPETMPNAQGFDSSYGHMGGCIDNYSHFFYWNGPNRHDLWRNGQPIHEDGVFFGDAMVREAKAFLTRNRDRPFFLYWAINSPHYPLQGKEKWRRHYEDLPAPRRMYAAFVSTLDELIGEVLTHLEGLGLKEDTLVIFQSDHGHSTEERTFFGGGSSGPYRGAKGCLFEGGIRVPSIVSWPAGLPKGQVREQLATGCDWLPTLAELCGVRPPAVQLDGRSLVPLLKDPRAESPHPAFYWHLGGGRNPQWAVREGEWKLLGNCRDNSDLGPLSKQDREYFLVNLERDPGEMTNVAADYPDVMIRLRELRESYLKDIEAP